MTAMKYKYLILTLTLLLIPALCFARKGNDEKQLMEYKLKFLAQEMDLKPDQQQRFVDLYTRMTAEKRAIYEDAIEMERRVKNNAKATAEDYNRATEAMSAAKIKEGQIDQKYEKEFLKFLTPKQLYKMKQAEEEFRKHLRDARKNRRR